MFRAVIGFALSRRAIILLGLIVFIAAGIAAWRLLQYRRRRMDDVVSAVAENIRRETEKRLLGGQNTGKA